MNLRVPVKTLCMAGALAVAGLTAPVWAVSKDAQELMQLREKRAPLECELTRLYAQVAAARKVGDDAKVKSLTARMHEVDEKLKPDNKRVEQLTLRVRGGPDHKAVLEQQLKLDKACKR